MTGILTSFTFDSLSITIIATIRKHSVHRFNDQWWNEVSNCRVVTIFLRRYSVFESNRTQEGRGHLCESNGKTEREDGVRKKYIEGTVFESEPWRSAWCARCAITWKSRQWLTKKIASEMCKDRWIRRIWVIFLPSKKDWFYSFDFSKDCETVVRVFFFFFFFFFLSVYTERNKKVSYRLM